MDFHDVADFANTEALILDSARMPWHDVSKTLLRSGQVLCGDVSLGAYDAHWTRCSGHCSALYRALE
jgi:hypothetical protein